MQNLFTKNSSTLIAKASGHPVYIKECMCVWRLDKIDVKWGEYLFTAYPHLYIFMVSNSPVFFGCHILIMLNGRLHYADAHSKILHAAPWDANCQGLIVTGHASHQYLTPFWALRVLADVTQLDNCPTCTQTNKMIFLCINFNYLRPYNNLQIP